jgi:hypothetical protein
MDANALQLVAQGGSTVILLVVLWFLWGEYKTQSAYIRDRLDKSDAERKVLAQELGLTTQQLNLRAQAIMERDKGSSA